MTVTGFSLWVTNTRTRAHDEHAARARRFMRSAVTPEETEERRFVAAKQRASERQEQARRESDGIVAASRRNAMRFGVAAFEIEPPPRVRERLSTRIQTRREAAPVA